MSFAYCCCPKSACHVVALTLFQFLVERCAAVYCCLDNVLWGFRANFQNRDSSNFRGGSSLC